MNDVLEHSTEVKKDTLIQRDMKRVLALQRGTALAWRGSSADERRARLRRLSDALMARRSELHQAGQADSRKPAAEVDMGEILPVLAEIKQAVKALPGWMAPTPVKPTPLLLGTRSEIRYEPRGTSLILSPWNFPVALTLGPLASALAADCPAVLKPSELTPHLSAVIAHIVRDAFDESEVAIFQGGPEVSEALLAQPFEHIFFTGSPAVGRKVMAAAAAHLSSVTLELGGKSPVIVLEDADLDDAVAKLAWGKFLNAGQICIAPDHVYVHERVADAFLRKLAQRIGTIYGRAPQQSPHYAAIVNDRHHERLCHALDEALARGASVACGGTVDAATRYIAPTVLSDCPPGCALLQDEIFGPILPVQRFHDIDAVIGAVNAREKALALYVFGKSAAAIEKVLCQTSSGGSCVNHVGVQFLHGNLPFGGVNHSGLGKSKGHFGFLAFSNERAVVRDRFSPGQLWFPPYTRSKAALLDQVLRWMAR